MVAKKGERSLEAVSAMEIQTDLQACEMEKILDETLVSRNPSLMILLDDAKDAYLNAFRTGPSKHSSRIQRYKYAIDQVRKECAMPSALWLYASSEMRKAFKKSNPAKS